MAVSRPEHVRWFGTSEASRNQAWLTEASAIVICCADLEGYVQDSQSAARSFRANNVLRGESMEGVEAYVLWFRDRHSRYRTLRVQITE